jgi:hypothetical protein
MWNYKINWFRSLLCRALRATPNEKLYGNSGTIHRTGYLDVETDPRGRVVSVWFRCLRLPFVQTSVPMERRFELQGSPVEGKLVAVHYETK